MACAPPLNPRVKHDDYQVGLGGGGDGDQLAFGTSSRDHRVAGCICSVWRDCRAYPAPRPSLSAHSPSSATHPTGVIMYVDSSKEVPGKKEDMYISYVAYHVVVKADRPAYRRRNQETPVVEFGVYRRYSEFLAFHERLTKEWGGRVKHIPECPAKSSVPLFVSGSQRDDRQEAFDRLMKFIAAHKLVRPSSCLRTRACAHHTIR